MVKLIFYSRKHGIKAYTRTHENLILNPKQVKRLEADLRDRLDACKITDTDGAAYLVDYESLSGCVKLSKEE